MQFDFRPTLQFLLPILAITIVGLIFTGIKLHQINIGYHLAHLEKEKHKLEQQRDVMALEVASLKNPKRLIQMGGNLGLKLPEDGDIIQLKP